MKRILAIFLAAFMMFALAACGEDSGKTPSGGTDKPDASQQGGKTDKKSWPSADFITPGMKYTGGGTITYVDYIDGATQEDGTSMYSVYINGATLDDAKKYIEALKTDGFAYYSAIGDSEPAAAFEFGYYEWKGEADGGKRFVIVYAGEEVDTYGGSGAEYTMYIMMANQNMSK